MGFMDYFSDLYASLSIQTAEAEEQQKDDSSDSGEGGDEAKSDDSGEGGGEGEEKSSEGGEGGGEESEGGGEEEGGESGGDEGGDDDEEEEEEEEEEEPEDIKEKLEAECMKTSQCAPLKRHYDECAERVQQQEQDEGKAKEDCVEEFFHMVHCATACAAPKLFRTLK